jgi:hypothetical protein
MRPKSLVWMSPPCSSWVVASRGSTKRSIDSVYGDESHSKVHNANIQAVHVGVCALICSHRSIWWALELVPSTDHRSTWWALIDAALFIKQNRWAGSMGRPRWAVPVSWRTKEQPEGSLLLRTPIVFDCTKVSHCELPCGFRLPGRTALCVLFCSVF